MSSLAATQADGYYIPPDYIESGAYKKKSLNQYNQSKGHNQYLQRSVVRFELPFDGFCTKCGAIVGKGTRFNAHKAHVDDYFTTKIYEFTTKCRSCANCEFKIRTNPKEQTFGESSVRLSCNFERSETDSNRIRKYFLVFLTPSFS